MSEQKRSMFAPLGAFTQTMSSMFEQQMSMAEQMRGEFSKVQSENMEKMSHMMQDMTKLAQSSASYQTALLDEWRKMSSELVSSMMSKND